MTQSATVSRAPTAASPRTSDANRGRTIAWPDLPADCQRDVLDRLAPADLIRAAQVATSWRRLALEPARLGRALRRLGMPPRTWTHGSAAARYWRLIDWQHVQSNRHRGAYAMRVMPAVHDDALFFLPAFSPSGRWVATGGFNDTVRLWSTDAPQRPTRLLRGHTGRIRAVAFSPDESSMVTASVDRTARLWPLRGATRVSCALQHGRGVLLALFSPDGSRLASVDDRDAWLWHVGGGERGPCMLRHGEQVTCMTFSRDGRCLATAVAGGTVRLWRVGGGAYPLQVFKGHRGGVSYLSFSLRDDRLWTVGNDATVRSWPREGAEAAARVLHLRPAGFSSATLSPDAACVLACESAGDARLGWVEDSNAASQDLRHALTLTCATFSPDSNWVATGTRGGTVRLWPVNKAKSTKAAPRLLRGHTAAVTSVRFSPDGRRLVTTGLDHRIRLWDFGVQAPAQGASDWLATWLRSAFGWTTSPAPVSTRAERHRRARITIQRGRIMAF